MTPALLAAAREAATALAKYQPLPLNRPASSAKASAEAEGGVLRTNTGRPAGRNGAQPVEAGPSELELQTRSRRMQRATQRQEHAATMEQYRHDGTVLQAGRPVLPSPMDLKREADLRHARAYLALGSYPKGTMRRYCEANGIERIDLIRALDRHRDRQRYLGRVA